MTLPSKERVADADGNPWADGISATVPDWSREAKTFFAWNPSRSLLASLRSHAHHTRSNEPWHLVMRRIAVLRHRFWSIVTGADVPLGSKIGGGLLLPHPSGVVIHPDAEIGPNCLIFQQVTVGMTDNGLPSLGGHVDLGAGAKVLGGIHVGNHSRVGANAVVLIDVPVGAVAAGVPAQIVWPRQAVSDRNAGTHIR
jgi:serine O-acetyltransferase